MEKGFRQRLAERQERVGSLVCLGLDPLPELMPAYIHKKYHHCRLGTKISLWMQHLVVAAAPYISLIKPQRAHYEALGHEGIRALENLNGYIRKYHPDIPICDDCKRGDIGRTQERYRIAHFDHDGADAMNFSPYMGKDCMEYLADTEHPEHGIVGLCYTSNQSAREVQDVLLADGRQYWEFIAERTLAWAESLGITENAGLVMAAAYEHPKGSGAVFSSHLTRCRQIVGDKLWFLIPGIGTQGGYIAETIRAAYAGYGSIAINSSSALIFASSEPNYAEACAHKAKVLRDSINQHLPV